MQLETGISISPVEGTRHFKFEKESNLKWNCHHPAPSSRTRRAEISWKMFFSHQKFFTNIFCRRLPILTFWCRRQNLDTFSVLCYVWRVHLTIFWLFNFRIFVHWISRAEFFNNKSLCLFFFPILLDGKNKLYGGATEGIKGEKKKKKTTTRSVVTSRKVNFPSGKKKKKKTAMKMVPPPFSASSSSHQPEEINWRYIYTHTRINPTSGSWWSGAFFFFFFSGSPPFPIELLVVELLLLFVRVAFSTSSHFHGREA